MSTTPRAPQYNVTTPDRPHLMVMRNRLVIIEKPQQEHNMVTQLPMLTLHRQKGYLVYCWRDDTWEPEVQMSGGFSKPLVKSGGFFAIEYREELLRPWPEHLDRLRRMMKYMPFARNM